MYTRKALFFAIEKKNHRNSDPSLDRSLIFISSSSVKRANTMMMALKSLRNWMRRSDSDELQLINTECLFRQNDQFLDVLRLV